MADSADEIEKIESAIADIESAISELKHCSYFEYKIASLEEDLRELNDRLQELEKEQDKEWKKEMQIQNAEYERSVL